MKRREKAAIGLGVGVAAAGAAFLTRRLIGRSGCAVNDVHAQINPTRVAEISRPRSLTEARSILARARSQGPSVALAGGRHAMGGQQFADGAVLIDMRGLDKVLEFDRERGEIEVEAGIQWPALVGYLLRHPVGPDRWWAITQKQTGADRLTVGGSLSANVHGRGLSMKPLIGDVASFTLLDSEGVLRHCSRASNPELFRLAIGGYGLFGLIYSVRLKLAPRVKVERVVELIAIERLVDAVEGRIDEGFVYGDFQFATDERSDAFLRQGVFSCYRPVPMNTPIPSGQKAIPTRAWYELVRLAHVDKSRAFQLYSDYYLSTTGQVYWSDTHQMAGYLDDYHRRLDRRLGCAKSTEIITEIYVPRPALAAFMSDVRDDFRRNGVNLIYGTIRMIEKDDESFLAWARDRYACVIFNLHTEHTPQGFEHSAAAFRRLIDLGIAYGGSFYLTYHRYATREQVEACYPRFAEFLDHKELHDPSGLFQSDWHRHNLRLFGRQGAAPA